MSKSEMVWHPASELPPLHEESFEDDGTVYRSMMSDWVLVRDDTCARTNSDPYTPPVRVSRFIKDDDGSMWDDGTGPDRSAGTPSMMPRRTRSLPAAMRT